MRALRPTNIGVDGVCMDVHRMNVKQDFGHYLRTERELRQVPLDDIAQATKIPVDSLHALEEGHWDILPAEIFVRGFVRSYARHLGLSEDETFQHFRSTLNQMREEADHAEIEAVGDSASEAVSTRRSFGVALFVIILLIIVTLTFSLLWSSGSNAASHASASSSVSTTQSHLG